eukprot:PLAT14784.2.p1 GENE.PLAT14784.2~~PLAT14784.2.p1  ORF type:complete len:754 (+),score=405.02 PLAT14784.2:40-2262(+)
MAEAFFTDNAADVDVAAATAQMDSWLQLHKDKRIALVTSGGTTVPLSASGDLFLDNFSTGTRGARCTMQFLAAGYCVLLLQREGSRDAFVEAACGKDGLSAAGLLAAHVHSPDCAACGSGCSSGTSSSSHLAAGATCSKRLLRVAEEAAAVAEEQRLLVLSFRSLFDYLHLLRASTRAVSRSHGERALLFLAAAVSDFYLPDSLLPDEAASVLADEAASEAVTASGSGAGLQLQLCSTPKLLRPLRQTWAPQPFMISFKLETDAGLLLAKATAALRNYGVDLVVANLLQTRYDACKLVTSATGEGKRDDADEDVKVVDVVRGSVAQLEQPLCVAVVAAHDNFLSAGGRRTAPIPPPPVAKKRHTAGASVSVVAGRRITAEELLAELPPPRDLNQLRLRVRQFIRCASAAGQRVICITAGAAQVPLELNTVRFIDVRDDARRAATALAFVRAGYSVLLLRRTGKGDAWLHRLAEEDGPAHALLPRMVRRPRKAGEAPLLHPQLSAAFRSWRLCADSGELLQLPFTTLAEYVHYLRVLTQELHVLRERAALLLAAELPALHLPVAEMATHKLQSDGSGLLLPLRRTPSLLRCVRSLWAPGAFVVTASSPARAAAAEAARAAAGAGGRRSRRRQRRAAAAAAAHAQLLCGEDGQLRVQGGRASARQARQAVLLRAEGGAPPAQHGWSAERWFGIDDDQQEQLAMAVISMHASRMKRLRARRKKRRFASVALLLAAAVTFATAQ